MASRVVSMVVTLLLLTLFPSPFARADDEFIRRECHNAEVPVTCIECVKSDLRGATADAAGIAVIVVDCVSNHASNLQGNMSLLAASTSNSTMKQVYQECSQWFSSAKKGLYAATIALKTRGYDSADQSVSVGLNYLQTCQSQIQAMDIRISEELVYEQSIYEELAQSAMRIINRLQ